MGFHYITFIHINYHLVYTLSYQDVKLYTQCLVVVFYPKEFLKFKHVKHTCIFVLHCTCIIFVANFMSRIFFIVLFASYRVKKLIPLIYINFIFYFPCIFKRIKKTHKNLNLSGEKLIKYKSLCKLFGVI